MWNLITIDNVKQTVAMTRTGGPPQYNMTHDKFHHTFTLPLWNKFAPLTIYNHNHNHHHHNNNKEFPEFKKQIDKIQCKNYLNDNQKDYHRIMGHQKIDECLYLGGSRPPSPPPPPPKIGNENEQIDKQQQILEKRKKRRRRKKRNNKNKTQQSSDDNNNCNKSATIESKLQRCDSLKLIKNHQRQRQISTDSDDSFIVFYDNNNCSNDGDVNKPSNFNNYHDDDDNYNSDKAKSLASDKKVRFADNNEIHPMVKWSYAYQAARKGPWEQYARDRDRFKKRIRNLEKLLSPVLNHKHRTKIYQERFI